MRNPLGVCLQESLCLKLAHAQSPVTGQFSFKCSHEALAAASAPKETVILCVHLSPGFGVVVCPDFNILIV